MKNEAQYSKKVSALIKRIKQASPAAKIEDPDPVTQLVYSFLEWNASRPQAIKAYNKITQIMVDNNDMRVSHAFEMVDIIGESYPQAVERCIRLHESLQEIFVREHIVSLASMQGKGKKQCLDYLESLPGIPAYVIRAVMAYGFGHTAIPVDDVAVMLCEQEEAIEPGSRPEEISVYLEKHVDAKDMLNVALHLRGWCDENTKLIKSLKKTQVLEAVPPVSFELITAEPSKAEIAAAAAAAAVVAASSADKNDKPEKAEKTAKPTKSADADEKSAGKSSGKSAEKASDKSSKGKPSAKDEDGKTAGHSTDKKTAKKTADKPAATSKQAAKQTAKSPARSAKPSASKQTAKPTPAAKQGGGSKQPAKQSTKPAVKPAAKPSSKPAAKPAAKSTSKPAAKSGSKPAAKPATKPKSPAPKKPAKK